VTVKTVFPCEATIFPFMTWWKSKEMIYKGQRSVRNHKMYSGGGLVNRKKNKNKKKKWTAAQVINASKSHPEKSWYNLYPHTSQPKLPCYCCTAWAVGTPYGVAFLESCCINCSQAAWRAIRSLHRCCSVRAAVLASPFGLACWS
jgi:hypothetical protein